MIKKTDKNFVFIVASKKSSSSGQSGGAMVTNKNEAQGNVTTNAKGNSIHGILNHCLFNWKC